MRRAFADAVRERWPNYAIEAAGLGAFMVSALGFTLLLEHPASPVRAALPDALARRALIGCAMGATLLALVYNPLGQRSGAHFNPVLTLTFLRLGKIAPADAALYAAAQFLGGAAGVAALALASAPALADAHVKFAVTQPGAPGVVAALAGEIAIAFVQMLLVLAVSNTKRLNAFTGVFAAVGVATYITLEAPLSGMSMNPARTVASALPSGIWTGAWIYFLAPPLGMLLAAEAFGTLTRWQARHCAKLDHAPGVRCIFCEASAA
jgi:aquaporin Z